MRLSFLCFTLLISLQVGCQNSETKPVFEYKMRASSIKTGQTPVLVMLHGYGSNEGDLFEFAQDIDERYLVVSARAPYPHSEGNYAWYGLDFSKNPYTSNEQEAEKSRLDMGVFVEQICKKYNGDASKVYLLGFSQGAMMSLTCALTMPEKVAGAVVLGGKLRDADILKIVDNQQLIKTKIYISHGKNDQRVPFVEAEKAKEFLFKKGITPTYEVYDMGHEINEANFEGFRKWLRERLN